MAEYNQFDVVFVNFPFTDLREVKLRPVIVLSNDRVNNTEDYLLIQITSQYKNDGLSIPINEKDIIGEPLKLKSYVRFHKIFLLNESLIIRKITQISPNFHSQILEKLNLILCK